MTSWLLLLMPQYVADRIDAYAWWLLSSLSWGAVFIFATRSMELSASSQAAFGIAASTLGALGAIDIAVHRLPRQISYVSLSLIGAFLVIGSASRSTQSADVVAGMALMFIVIGALRFVSRGSLGSGDLHLAPLLGALIGWFDPYRVFVACAVMAVSAGIVAGGLVISRRRRASEYIAYGPFMLLGTAVAIIGTSG